MEQKLSFSIVSAKDYPTRLAEEIANAKTRVLITTMTLSNDCPEVDVIIDSLIFAAKRSVSVSVTADSMTYLEPKEHLLELVGRLDRVKQSKALGRKLRKAGVDFRWLGETKVGLIGRVHSKWAVVDDVVYSFGGVNLDRHSFKNIDYMIRSENHELANFLADAHERIRSADRGGYSLKNVSKEFDNATIIIDGGRAIRSAIYNRAKQLTRSAKNVTFVSQYCPSGSLAKLLKTTNNKLYFNPPETTKTLNTLVIKSAMKLSRFTTSYSKNSYLHAKCMIFEMVGGEKIALTGSHNFASLGILLGTREIALETNDPQLIADLENFISNNIAGDT